MAAYTTQQHLIDIYGEQRLIDLTDRATPAADAIDADIIAQAITDASALIDGYLLPRYTLPLPSTPDLLKQLASQIVFYKLHIEQAPDKVLEDYKGAFKTLEWLSTGKVKLNIAGVEPEATNVGEVTYTAADRVDISDYAGST